MNLTKADQAVLRDFFLFQSLTRRAASACFRRIGRAELSQRRNDLYPAPF